MPAKQVFKKGQYVVCKYRGAGNGDVVAARVESVRHNGTVQLEDLFTKKIRVKSVRVLQQRNVVVPKKFLDRVMQTYRGTGSLSEARETVVFDLEKLEKKERGQHPHREIDWGRVHSMFAVVYARGPLRIVEDTGAPFDGKDIAAVEAEVCATYGKAGLSPREFLEKAGWRVVPCTERLSEQYLRLGRGVSRGA